MNEIHVFRTDDIGLDDDDDLYLKVEADAELQRHKRAIEWCLSRGAWLDKQGGIWTDMTGENDFAITLPPSDIADLIKGEK